MKRATHPLSASLDPATARRYDPTRDPDLPQRPSPYTSDEILSALCRSGLGKVAQPLITPDQIRRALAGETVTPTARQLQRSNASATVPFATPPPGHITVTGYAVRTGRRKPKG